MDNTKNDSYYINHIIEDLSFIIRHTKDIDSAELGTNELLLDSMLFRLIQISENSRKLSEDYREKRKNVPWNAMYGLRNRIVHDYGNVDLSIVYMTLKEDIPVLLDMIYKADDSNEPI